MPDNDTPNRADISQVLDLAIELGDLARRVRREREQHKRPDGVVASWAPAIKIVLDDAKGGDMNEDNFDDAETPGMAELADSWDLFKKLRYLKSHDAEKARLWAIAATEAERLHAWIAYVVGVASDETVAE